MDVEAFLICDAATDQQGKLNILGAFDCFIVRETPYIHPQFSVALRLRFKKSESGNHPFRINLIDEDGKSIMPPLNGNVNVQIEAADETAVVNMALSANKVKFDRLGRFSVDFTMDGKLRGALPIFVKQLPARP